MAISYECGEVGADGRELVQHGSTQFPIACYQDDLVTNAVPWHWHEELEMAIVTEGVCLVAIGNQKFILQEGDALFVNSGILHGMWSTGLKPCRYHSFVFHHRLVSGGLDSIFYQNYIHPLITNHQLEYLILSPAASWQKHLIHSIETVWKACAEEPLGYEFQVRSLLSDILFQIGVKNPAQLKAPSEKSMRDGRRIKTMLQFIQDHFAEELTMGQIAESASISESECLRCFRSSIGIPPIQYLKQYRIQQACYFLTTTSEKVSEIAPKCGFQDISYFTKTFREEKKCPPGEYRKRQSGK